MLLKLSFSSMRKMFKDYLVLLFGLTISIAIFYMFETLAQNKAFLESNAMISSIVFIFHVGTFILAFITLFYIFYATSFMLSMRQKELGMYMTLGAKKHKVAQLMFFETFFIGIISLVVGVIVGVGFAQGIAGLLMDQLDFSGEGFHALYKSSVITTVIFYVALFLLTSIVNAIKISSKSVLDLLHAEEKHDQVKAKGGRTILGVIFAVILIGAGYYAMFNMAQLAQFGVILAAITITLGTYLMFISLLPYLMKKVKGIRTLNEKGINSFTFAQLRFRMGNLTKVLGTVAMLVALGLGAMTAGLSFYNNVELQASMFHGNDVTIHQPTEKDIQALNNMNTTEENTYHYKVDDNGVYFLKKDLLDHPPLIKQFNPETLEMPEPKRVATDLPDAQYSNSGAEGMKNIPDPWSTALSTELRADFQMFGDRDIFIVDQAHYQKVTTAEQKVVVARVADFMAYLPQLEKIEKRQQQLAASYTGEPGLEMAGGSKFADYMAYKGIASGTIFMGFFLGVAFLMMMASVLMFKLLSSASADTHRYSMLRKIGVRKSLLVKSIYKELFLLFLFPGLVGLVHVLVGMQMFSFILVEPYTKIWLPISIFIVIYGVYYWLTVQMYKRIVLPREA
ncbi:FtsX-like permease family protein [Virgibacillus dakarensis]|uniref:ABC transporter permease n=1 Tax=Lentibacillus populi TaxID=1827502 RepID=A0A9W5TWE2_9BACI|nr:MULTISPECIES: ABC transporter permease [Bacillaceae]MBT2217313.1 ABC transporter permease [Virgibacillus dakarensis]MTW86753.1 FtsX-like permease family protein [Virgibacillus dakarensis]GGB38105.1 ABC transporter permease [Lentibacillus populi]